MMTKISMQQLSKCIYLKLVEYNDISEVYYKTGHSCDKKE